MNEDIECSQESISGCSPMEEESHLRVARPPSRHRTVIDDENISDSSSDCGDDVVPKRSVRTEGVVMDVVAPVLSLESDSQILKIGSKLDHPAYGVDDDHSIPQDAEKLAGPFTSTPMVDALAAPIPATVGPFTSDVQSSVSASSALLPSIDDHPIEPEANSTPSDIPKSSLDSSASPVSDKIISEDPEQLAPAVTQAADPSERTEFAEAILNKFPSDSMALEAMEETVSEISSVVVADQTIPALSIKVPTVPLKITPVAVRATAVSAVAASAVSDVAPAAVVNKTVSSIPTKVSALPVKAPVPVRVTAVPVPVRVAVTSSAAPIVSIRARSGSADLTSNRVTLSSTSTSSSATSGGSRSVIRSVGSSCIVEEKETAERWRDRLWPSRALTSFCRSITRCTPPVLQAGKHVFAGQCERDGEKKIRLIPHWENGDLQKVINTYDTLSAHNAAFFLLLVEESREASMQDASDFEVVRKPQADGANGWATAEVLQVVSEMKSPVSTTTSLLKSQQPFRSQSDPRLGTVWVVRIAISPFNKDTHIEKSSYKYNDFGMAEFFQSGDLLLIHCHGLERPLLGVVQIWDPDFESKFGVSLSKSANNNGSGNKSHLVDSNGRDTVNVLICIDSGCGATDDNSLGGWAPQGLIVPGLVITGICALGNVLTSIRECQALMSLRSLSKSLQEVVLCGGSKGMQYSAGSGSVAVTGGSDSNGLPHRANSAFSNTVVKNTTKLSCPETLPSALWTTLCSQYNSSQLRAIHAVCLTTPSSSESGRPPTSSSSSASSSAATVTLLQGPPGTGKTRTVLAVVAALLAGGGSAKARTGSKVIAGSSLRNPGAAAAKASSMAHTQAAAGKKIRVLVCGPSNTAVDELTYRLFTHGVLGQDGHRQNDLSIVRIGVVGGRKDKEVDKGGGKGGAKFTAPETSHMISVVEKLSLDYLVDEKRRSMYSDYGGHDRPPNIMDIRKQILEKADVVCCTLSGAGSQPILEVVMRIPGFKFDAVIIDEAAQAVEPSTLIPFKFNPHRVVMVGDPCQLPATVFSRRAKDANYGQSLFQRLFLAGYPVMMLETQYRMHKAIAEYPSERFYEGKLLTDQSVAESGSHDKPYHLHESGKFGPVVLHNVGYGMQSTDGNSISNRDEALYVVALYESLYELYPAYRAGVGIIAPYKAQRRLIKTMFKDRFGPSMGGVEISTIDGFQGREKEVVIFSCVRAPAYGRNGVYVGGIGFLKEWQRLNVAITRAKYAVWIVGHAETLGTDMEWKHLLDFCKEKSYFLDVPMPANKKDQGAGKYKKKHNKNKNKNHENNKNEVTNDDNDNNMDDNNDAADENVESTSDSNNQQGVKKAEVDIVKIEPVSSSAASARDSVTSNNSNNNNSDSNSGSNGHAVPALSHSSEPSAPPSSSLSSVVTAQPILVHIKREREETPTVSNPSAHDALTQLPLTRVIPAPPITDDEISSKKIKTDPSLPTLETPSVLPSYLTPILPLVRDRMEE